ncbi:unnamed protein product, partial [marine sediment metagenome]
IEIIVIDNDYSETLKLKEGTKNFMGKELMSSKISVFALKGNDEVIGACSIRNPFNVFVIYIEEDYRGLGLGNELIKTIINKAKNKELRFITLTVSSDNSAASNLYSNHGFKKITHLKKSKQILFMLPINFTGKTIFNFLKNLCLIIPNIFQSYIHEFLYKISIYNN